VPEAVQFPLFAIFDGYSLLGEQSMNSFVQYIEKAGLGGVFEDSAIKVMGEAFDAA
jgi:hypothetical protein